MSITKQLLIPLTAGAILVAATFQNPVAADDVPLVDGTLWEKSTEFEKKAFLVGISNLLSVEYAFQVRGDNPPSDKQSIVRRFYEQIDDVTLDQAIRRVDQWYKDNPGGMSKPVLSVIWIDMVEPNL